jgi:hypothetical protein
MSQISDALKNSLFRNQEVMKMALKNPSANCFRKFKGLQLTFQVVYLSRTLSQGLFARFLSESLSGAEVCPIRVESIAGC